MGELVQRHDLITYDGSNSAEVLAFFSNVNGPIATWSIDSESGGELTLRCDLSGPLGPFGPPPPFFVSMSPGDVFTRATDMTGSDSFQGPWQPGDFAAAFKSVPSAADFDALAARVAALEPTQKEEQ